VRPAPLGPWSRRIVRALAEVIVPRGGGAPEVELGVIVAFVDDFTRHLPRLFRTLFPVGLLLVELGAIVFAGSLLPFSLLPPDRRHRQVEGWLRARWHLRRDLMKGLKGLCLFAYYSDPRVAAHLGYAVEEHVHTVAAERLVRHGHEL
jgi:hypothetical protein